MIYGTDCQRRYGYADDNKVTSVNELTEFQKKWLITWDIPQEINDAIPCLPNRLYCNKDLVGPLEKALRLAISRNLHHEIKTFDGCYNLRAIRAYEKQYNALVNDGKMMEALKFMSIHSYAVAIDINAAWNGLGKVPTMSKELVACFKEAGFDWGGNFTRKDGMHFQLAQLPK